MSYFFTFIGLAVIMSVFNDFSLFISDYTLSRFSTVIMLCVLSGSETKRSPAPTLRLTITPACPPFLLQGF